MEVPAEKGIVRYLYFAEHVSDGKGPIHEVSPGRFAKISWRIEVEFKKESDQ